jgi:hypothetical protein
VHAHVLMRKTAIHLGLVPGASLETPLAWVTHSHDRTHHKLCKLCTV